jgi:hypothetical protein
MPTPYFEVPAPYVAIPEPAPPNGEISPISEMVDRAVSRLIEYFRKGPRNRSFVGGAVTEVQILEDALSTLVGLSLDNSTGETLNQIGRLVREPRAGLDDVSYAAAIRTRILASRSRGRIQDLISIARSINSDAYPVITESFPPQLTFFGLFTGSPDAALVRIGRVLRSAKAAGVRLDLALGSAEGVIGSRDGVVHGNPAGSADGTVAGFQMYGLY